MCSNQRFNARPTTGIKSQHQNMLLMIVKGFKTFVLVLKIDVFDGGIILNN